MKNHIKRFSVLVLILLVTNVSFAQNRGNIRGSVTDESGSFLPGAAVAIKNTNLGTATDISGSFLLQGVKSGEVEVQVNYLGYSSVSLKANIENGKTAELNFTLKEQNTNINEVVISGVIDGQQRALNQQRSTNQLMQVLSMEQIGRFPDLNVADALRRLSGVTSDGAQVQLRGTPANFTNITVNGEQVMSAQEYSRRNESLNIIPSDIISSIEVQKTLLPSNDGDAIAGTINMRTGTALSLKGKGVIDLGSSFSSLREKFGATGKIGYQKRFAPSAKNPNGAFGISANYSYNNSAADYDRLEAKYWVSKTILNSSFTTSGTTAYIPTDFRYRYQNTNSTRQGGTIALDWAPNRDTKFVLSTMYNEKNDLGINYRNRYRFRGNVVAMEGNKYGTDRVMAISQAISNDEKMRNLNMNLDGETVIGSWKIDGGLFLNKSSRKYEVELNDFYAYPEARAGKNGIAAGTVVGVIPDITTQYLTLTYPMLSPITIPATTNKAAFDDPYLKRFLMQSNLDENTNSQNFTARFNVSKNFFIGSGASTLSFGAKGKFMTTSNVPEHIDSYAFAGYYVNPFSVPGMTDFIQTTNLSSKFLNSNLNFGPAADLTKINDYFASKPAAVSVNKYYSNTIYDMDYYRSDEKVISGYLMDKIQFSKLLIIAGIRLESSHSNYDANKIRRFINPSAPTQNGDATVFNDYQSTPIDSVSNYTIILPNFQMKYDFNKNNIARISWTTGYSRPNIRDLIPRMDVSQDDNWVLLGNSTLKPAFANNLDLMYESYLKNVGIISGGLFFKNIKNYLYLSSQQITSGEYAGYFAQQQRNGDNATVLGFEVNLNTSLTFLPGFLKNLVFTSNYTFVNSKAKVDDVRGTIRLPGQANQTGNIALAYSNKRFTIQSSANYNSEYVESLGSIADRDVWRDAHWQIDANASCNIYKGLVFFAEATNIFNSESFSYMGNKSRVYSLQFDGAKGRIGFSYKF
ncbi:MAG: TonB-dependent receptor [Prolixibacteraceae bacterium]